MTTLILVIHILLAVVLVGLVLLQHGKGADAGAAFGSGASATVFGARGSANFLSKSTAWVAFGFFITSLALAWLARNQQPAAERSVVESVETQPAAPAPVAPTDSLPAAAPAETPAADPAPGTDGG
jgi:preprotein translocase subunit SecG